MRFSPIRREFITATLIVCLMATQILARPSKEEPNPTADESYTTNRPEAQTAEVTYSKSSENRGNKQRNDKNVSPAIGDSIQMVASQLLQSTTISTSTPMSAIVDDTRIPPKVKNHFTKTKQTTEKYGYEVVENSHAGVAVPVSLEDLDIESHDINTTKETTTTQEGISTWVLLNSPTSTLRPEKTTSKTKVDNSETKKPTRVKPDKNVTKGKKPTKRPIIAGPHKSDLIAGGSAINENVFNKIKETVLNNVQKNSALNKTTTLTTTVTTHKPSTLNMISLVTKKDFTTKMPKTTKAPVVTVTEKSKIKKKNKNPSKHKISTVSFDDSDSALLPLEPKDQEIELEVSTPAMTTKKPKQTTTKRKKNKTKKRKTTSTEKPDLETSPSKLSNSTKISKQPNKQKPITTQIYNYLSREVMPTVGVGIVGLAGLVGLASYFLYPFAGPVRRAYNIDKKDDIYRNNAEEYANEGNGQAEEEMLGTVLAGMPSKNKRNNPYAGQAPYRQKSKSESDQVLRYRHSSLKGPSINANPQYLQDKSEVSHDLSYSQPIAYNIYESDRNNVVNTYGSPEPMFPQITPSRPISYNGESVNNAYRISTHQKSSFEPAYPFEGQVVSDTTNNPNSFPSTSMYLGSDDESRPDEAISYMQSAQEDNDADNQFVVGNVPKELVQQVTPAVVPEHGPRRLQRKKRNIIETLEEVLRAAKKENMDNEIADEIDEALGEKHSSKYISDSISKSDSSKGSSSSSSSYDSEDSKSGLSVGKQTNIESGISDYEEKLNSQSKQAQVEDSDSKEEISQSKQTQEEDSDSKEERSQSKQTPGEDSDSKEEISLTKFHSVQQTDSSESTKTSSDSDDKDSDKNTESEEFAIDLPSVENISTKPLSARGNDIEVVNNITPEPPNDFDNGLTKGKTGNPTTLKYKDSDLTTARTTTLSAGITMKTNTPNPGEETKWTKKKLDKNKVWQFVKRMIEFKYNLAREILHASSRGLSTYINGNEKGRYDMVTPFNRVFGYSGDEY